MTIIKQSLAESIRHAFYLAQAGNAELGMQKITHIRHCWQSELTSATIIELMIAEGICLSYSGDLALASDRLRRAAVGAGFINSSDLSHMAHGWLASVQFNRGAMLDSVECVVNASRHIRGVRSDGRFRSAIIIAVLNEFCGRSGIATDWFRCAQRIAPTCASPSAMSLLVYNMCTLRTSVALLDRFWRHESESNSELNLLFVRSSLNLDSRLNVSVQNSLHLLVEAQALSLVGRYGDSLSLLEEFLKIADSSLGVDLVRANFEYFLCRCRLGINASQSDVETLEGLLPTLASDDDRAIALYILGALCEAVAMNIKAQDFRGQADSHVRRHLELRAAISRGLDGALLTLDPVLWIDEVS